jgi:hypothetical protein
MSLWCPSRWSSPRARSSYSVIPGTHVRLHAALIGGVVVGMIGCNVNADAQDEERRQNLKIVGS